MSRTVDERVVSMQFDNKQFESNVQTTLGTLDKLKKSLNLEGASKGLENIESSAKKIDFMGLTNAVENVRVKFSALQVMGVTALANITNSAVNAGKKIAHALTVEPIMTGLQEYETQINAVQTILANTESKGTTLKDVNGALDELNTYADKTIYNFTEMTRNIGTFTAAGVDLDTSVNAIQGIANLAAVSGSNSQQASTAMYQLSQAMASGTVKLMDWNSVVNAGMGGQVFQDALKETAKVHGVNVDAMIKKHGSFRETLQEGWITTDILTETLSHFTMAATEGSKEWGEFKKALMDQGYSEKQAEAILKMSNTATDAATKVKTATQLFDTLKETAQSGWTQTWELIFGDFEEAKNLFSTLYETLSPIIEASSKARNDVLKGWSEAGGRDDLIESLQNVFKAISSIVKPIKEAFNDIFPISLKEKVNGLVSFTEALKEFTAKLTLSDTASANLKRTFSGVFALVDIGVQVIKALFKGFAALVGYVAPAGNGILGLTASIGDFIVKIRDAIKSSDAFNKIVEVIGKVLKPIADGVKTLANSIKGSFKTISDTAETRFGPLTALGNALKAVFVGIAAVVSKAMPVISSIASKIGEAFKGIQDRLSEAIGGADYSGFFDLLNGGIFSAIGIFIAKFIKSAGDLVDNAGGFIEGFKDILDGAKDALNAFTESLKAETLKKIATAIGILAASLFVISLIDSEKLTASLAAVAALFAELMAAMSIFGKLNEKGLKGVNKTTFAMIGMAYALLILSAALKIMGSMSWKEMGVGLITMTAALGAMVGVIWALPKEKELSNASKAISSFAKSLVIMAVALKIMGSMSWKEMGIGLITMAAALGAMIGVIWALPNDAGAKATGILGFAAAMVILASALKILGSMSLQEMCIGLTAMAVALGAMIGVVWALEKAGNLGTTALSLIAMSTALLILSAALNAMGSMSWEEVIRGLVTLAGAFVIIGAAGYLLGPLAPAILALAGSIALLGVGVLAAGVGVLAFAAGLTALAAALAASGGAIVVFVTSIISLIPFLLEQIGIGIIKICEVIAGSAAAICSAITVIVLAVVDALVTCIPAIAEGAFKLIVGLLEILITYLPQIVPLLVTLLVKLVDLIVTNLPAILDAVVRLWVAIMGGIASRMTELMQPMVELLGAVFEGIAAIIGPVVQEVIAPLLEVLLEQFTNFFTVLAPYIPDICDLFETLSTNITNAIISIVNAIAPYLPEITNIVQIIADVVTNIIDNVTRLFEQISPILDSIANIISEVGTAISDALTGVSDIIDSIGGVIKSWFDGIAEVIDSVGEAALNAGTGFEKLANGVKTITDLKLGDMAASLAAVATGVGSIAKHGNGVSKVGSGMKQIATNVSSMSKGFTSATAGLKAMVAAFVGANATMKKIGDSLLKNVIVGIETNKKKLAETAKASIKLFVDTIKHQQTDAKSACTKLVTTCATAIKELRSKFKSAGADLVKGFAEGISANRYLAEARSRAMASAAAEAARKELDEHSPSKVGYKIGDFFGVAFVNAIGDYAYKAYKAGANMGKSAKDGLNKTVSKVADILSGDFTAQPTIRPVLDLSNVESGASAINNILSRRTLSVGTQAVGMASASMAELQNGRNSDKLTSAIKGLRKDLANAPRNTYNVNGLSYSEGSDVAGALTELVRLIKIEGRA